MLAHCRDEIERFVSFHSFYVDSRTKQKQIEKSNSVRNSSFMFTIFNNWTHFQMIAISPSALWRERYANTFEHQIPFLFNLKCDRVVVQTFYIILFEIRTQAVRKMKILMRNKKKLWKQNKVKIYYERSVAHKWRAGFFFSSFIFSEEKRDAFNVTTKH